MGMSISILLSPGWTGIASSTLSFDSAYSITVPGFMIPSSTFWAAYTGNDYNNVDSYNNNINTKPGGN